MTAFDRLHPAIRHHIVNTLEWKSLRPLQEAAIEPIVGGEHAILLAPTAGGKTEAAVFPVLSRMLAEDWRGLSVLYVCPIKALLNNLEPRLRGYAELLGRRAALWHGDVGQSARRRILREPPDLLLTTPESIEVMLTSVRTDHRTLFEALRCVVVDEMHAFAGDDRGWHLLAVVERLARLAGRDLQRVGLSATIGNAAELLDWLAGSSTRGRRVIEPHGAEASAVETDVSLDYVGKLANAAKVISRLHRGEKRLVFCDSRARVEELAVALREAGVATFVSHSSLSLDERRRAEEAFAQGRDAVIVATSTLELGIDVGDLDRVIQIDAPSTVASFLQRLGRTGRRPGSVRNCLLLATSESSFLQAAGLLQLWSEGYVEPVEPPPLPYHVLAQQIMGLVLQERGIGRHTWREQLAGMPAFRRMDDADGSAVVDHMIAGGILFEDSGILSFGPQGERSYGYRNFMEVLTVFTGDPLFVVRHGREELGHVHPASFLVRSGQRPVILLAGRSWAVLHIDWRRRAAYVEPTREAGRSQWLGSGQPLHFDLCRAVRRVLARGEPAVNLTARGKQALESLVEGFSWVNEHGTAVVRESGGSQSWWTFAGLAANSALAAHLGPLQREGARGHNLAITLDSSATASEIERRLEAVDPAQAAAGVPVSDEALEGLKFHACLPRALAVRTLTARFADPEAVEACLTEPIRSVWGESIKK